MPDLGPGKTSGFPSIRILETRVDMVGMPDVMTIMSHWIEAEPDRVHHVVNTGMHGIMEAHKNRKFGATLDAAELLAPDGILAILVARFHGHRIKKQDTGPDLLWRFSEVANKQRYKYFFYGDTDETLKLLSSKINSEFPGLKIVGAVSPPYRPLTTEEDEAMVAKINESKPDVLWVGLGMPAQDQWIYDHRQVLNVPVAVGTGASFKFISGTVSRAPELVRNLGFEWAWRLFQEPKRVWRRVVLDAPRFIVLVSLQLTGIRKFKPRA
jgi:N-acetylglucosaminyldiphosphoundecaprenol N-acetyl-beta-D-mannosaminyltransferase